MGNVQISKNTLITQSRIEHWKQRGCQESMSLRTPVTQNEGYVGHAKLFLATRSHRSLGGAEGCGYFRNNQSPTTDGASRTARFFVLIRPSLSFERFYIQYLCVYGVGMTILVTHKNVNMEKKEIQISNLAHYLQSYL